MKFNWGTGITFFIISFMGFILFLVVVASSTKSDLYAEDYYSQEINYQSKIDAIHNASNLKGIFEIRQDDANVIISFPNDIFGEDLSGSIHFYRPENASLDRVFEINLDHNKQYIPLNKLVSGGYIIKFDFQSLEINYFVEKEIIIH